MVDKTDLTEDRIARALYVFKAACAEGGVPLISDPWGRWDEDRNLIIYWDSLPSEYELAARKAALLATMAIGDNSRSCHCNSCWTKHQTCKQLLTAAEVIQGMHCGSPA